jgi:renalase
MASKKQTVAIIGSGIAGATCAHTLSSAGHAVHVFEKSRGPGGRLASRRFEWIDREGQSCVVRIDHGALGITARSPEFQAFVNEAVAAEWLVPWAPAMAAESVFADNTDPFYLPVPDMPWLCRHLLEGLPATWAFTVDAVTAESLGWRVHAASERHPQHFDAVVFAVPPAQAAPLLAAHRADWAKQAAAVKMQPCWTLLGVADNTANHAPHWALARPLQGLLEWLLRSDMRPGRAHWPEQAHWVAHAQAGWSQQHLEQPAAWVQQQMQAAVDACLGHRMQWQHCLVHRWRYALPCEPMAAPAANAWWDSAQNLGVCGDFLGGVGAESGVQGGVQGGVEGAWLSAQSLCKALMQSHHG